MNLSRRRPRALAAALALIALAVAACGDDKPTTTASDTGGDATTTSTAAVDPNRVLKISAIPDQDPSKLSTINTAMATYLSTALGRKVEYVPVTDYAASVSLFRTGDLDMVFFGGLTGVQARLQTPGAVLLAQRDIDDAFQTVFIANAGAKLAAVDDVKGLAELKGKRFTFGSESSTSGRLMPEFFLDQAGLASATDFSGPAGFSGSHDKTIDLVQAGTYDAGALNLQVWKKRKEAGTVDTTKVVELLVSPPYHDYHWMAGPDTDERFGTGFTDKVSEALLALDYSNPEQAKLLDLYGAKKFIATSAANYTEIEQIGRKLNVVTG
ncbi:MAG: putative selenate ABC transporter substrate-binding protein [Acidimicrobiales bacterium]